MLFNADQSFLKSLLCAPDAQSACRTVASKIGESLGAQRVVISLNHPVAFMTEWAVEDVVYDDASLVKILKAHFAHFCDSGSMEAITFDSRLSSVLLRERYASLHMQSFVCLPLYNGNVLFGLCLVVLSSETAVAEILPWLQEQVELCAASLAGWEHKSPVVDSRYQRFIEHADAIVLRVDPEQNITFISKRSIDFFGVAPEDFVTRQSVSWIDLAHPEDRTRIRRMVAAISAQPRTFDEEFRIVNHVTGRVRWLLLRFVPVFSHDQKLVAWEGFGFDATDRKDAQGALEQQNRRIRALFTVSAAISGFIDPANISSRGLIALCEATGADAALCYLYLNKDEKKLSLVSHHGFSGNFATRVAAAASLPNLSQYVAESGHPVVVPDMRTDPRASTMLADDEGMRSTVLVPIQVEDDILGAVSLFSRSVAKFDGSDVMLVNAAASQIGLAARQAQLFTAYRNQTKSLAALYRMSRELTRNLSLEEIFQNAFSIMRDELGLTRLWLGMLNETGSRLIGQAAYGPGWKRRLIEMNVELSGDDNPIARVVAARTALFIKNPAEALQGYGFRKFFSTLEIHSIVFVPIMADMQVIGVLAVQPSQDEEALDSERMTLLSSLADEIASVVLTKRLEERVNEGDKMRAAGLLAAGIAHNFNNLLQAILGQASLADIQKNDPGAVGRASKIIIEAASKGSALVKQLLSFAHLEYPSPETVDVNAMLQRTSAQFSRLLRPGQELRLNLKDGVPKGRIDPQQLSRIISSIIQNSSESMDDDGEVEIFTDSISISHSNPHFEVPYGTYVRIGIRDNGIGMDAETKRRCFEPFFTTKDRDPTSGLNMSGAGLGLASAYALARRNGGRLVVDSRPGYGSLFTIYIAVEQSEKAVTDDALSMMQAAATGEVSVQQLQVERIKNISTKEKVERVMPEAAERKKKSKASDE